MSKSPLHVGKRLAEGVGEALALGRREVAGDDEALGKALADVKRGF